MTASGAGTGSGLGAAASSGSSGSVIVLPPMPPMPPMPAPSQSRPTLTLVLPADDVNSPASVFPSPAQTGEGGLDNSSGNGYGDDSSGDSALAGIFIGEAAAPVPLRRRHTRQQSNQSALRFDAPLTPDVDAAAAGSTDDGAASTATPTMARRKTIVFATTPADSPEAAR